MRNFKLLTAWLLIGVTISNCEIPKEPDFTTSHTIEAPLLQSKEFQFLGGGGPIEALIDTTKGEFDSLFVVDDITSLISLSIEEDFDFGDLNDAIPEISTDPTTFSSEVGEIELGSFSSGGGNLGTASFQDLTGLNPSLVPAGTPIPAGSTPSAVNIDVGANTDFFVSATIKRGAIEISVTNNLGFDIAAINVNLNSGSSFVASTTISNVNHGVTSSDQITFSDGDILEDINVDITVNWLAQNTQANPGALVVEQLNGVGLVASEVEAAVTPQDFSTSSTTTFDASEFTFTDAAHYVELESGTISLNPIVNGLDLTVESLIISFPGIREFPYSESDSLTIRYTNENGEDNRILRSSTANGRSIDLTGYRLFALNNEVSYNISALTENTQDAAVGDQTRTINENQAINSGVEIVDLKIAEAFGNIAQQVVLLGDDDPSNGVDIIDAYNETEVELTEIDGLEDLSSQIDGIEFTNASLSINYSTDIGVPTTIYAIFLAVDGDGGEIFLNGNDGSPNQVQVGDPISGIFVNGLQAVENQLVKIEIDPSLSGNLESKSVTFDSTTTNIGPFLNSLPKEIRFLGKSVINQSGGEATIKTPLNFDPSLSIDLPLAFKTTTAATFSDTTETSDLEDVPSRENGDDATISEAILSIGYDNGLPLGFGLRIRFLDELGVEIPGLALPISSGEQYDLLPAQVDTDSRFASTSTPGTIQIAMDQSQTDLLYRTASVIIDATLETSSNEEVKIRATDSISLSVSVKITLENTVN
ncbi:MAG: hypothetical protein BalsKO_14990 [Balneolaceae bacterium]